jgi:hypothetical protein
MTKYAITTAMIMLMTSFGASANFSPWETEKCRLHEVQSQPAEVKMGPFYRDDARVIVDTPDAIQRAATNLGAYYRKS